MTVRPSPARILVAYGSDMGNAQDAATSLAASVGGRAVELNEVDPAGLHASSHLLIACSTFGDGEFPDNAAVFWETLSADGAPRLDGLRFAVLALGDTAYDHFCNAGRLLDERLASLGATRILARADVDGPPEKPAAAWTEAVLSVLRAAPAKDPQSDAKPLAVQTLPQIGNVTIRASAPAPVAPVPVEAVLTVNRRLTAAGSEKEVRHYELDLTGTGIDYRAGDSLAVHPANDPELVEALLDALDTAPDAVHDGRRLAVLLTEDREIRIPSRALRELAGDVHDAEDVLDIVRRARLSAEAVLPTLRPLRFRDYSIASSPLTHPGSAHLTVTTVRYDRGGRRHGGVASTHLAAGRRRVAVHLRPNHAFRLPAPDVPIIMVGPGTGIAPFRAFLQERRATNASGRSWLFFGDRRRSTDYLYGDELEAFRADGVLTRLDLAFSRDGRPGTAAKDYVQDRMREHADELWAWLADGAHLYVCGDESRMARDVDAALHEIVAGAAGTDAAGAHRRLNELIVGHRYLRDVY